MGSGRSVVRVIFILTLLAVGRAHGAQPDAERFVLPSAERIRIEAFSPHIQLLEDTSGKLSVEDVAGPANERFVPATLASANIGFTDSVWWARFTLRNDGAAERQVFLRQTYPLIDYVDLYEQLAPGDWRAHRTGDRLPFNARDIAHRDLVFPLQVPAHGERAVYLRFQSEGPIDISLSLYSAPELLESFSREQLAYGIYYGCVIMLLVWSSLVFIAVRDNAFLAYFIYVATFGLYMLMHNGLAYQYLWPNSPRWGNTALIILISVALLAGLQFSRMILHAKTYTSQLDRVAQGLQVVAAALLAAVPFVAYAKLIVPVTLLILISVIFMLLLGIASVLKGFGPARFYVIAWGSFLGGSVVFLLKTFGVLPHTFFTQNGWQIGSLLEMVLLSMALGTRMYELQYQNRTDPLTLLGNRRLFDERLPNELALARQQRRPLSLLVLDIDHFKNYNDRHGHAQGDAAIKAVAAILRKHARKPFVACRYGGEEFTMILPGADSDAAAALAERLRRTVEESLGGGRAITISVGYACLSQSQFDSAEKFFEAADFALYSAKERGRNCVVAFQGRRAEDAAQPAGDLATQPGVTEDATPART